MKELFLIVAKLTWNIVKIVSMIYIIILIISMTFKRKIIVLIYSFSLNTAILTSIRTTFPFPAV